MITIDDRTPMQVESHPCLVVATDRHMSGWGHAEGGSSYAAWACRVQDEDLVLRWLHSRGDMVRIRTAGSDYLANSRYCVHLHIYVVDENHRALN